MEKSIEDYRRELMDMAMRGNAGTRELFAEDSEVEVVPPAQEPPQMPPMTPQTPPAPPRPTPPEPPMRPTPTPTPPAQEAPQMPPRPTPPMPLPPQMPSRPPQMRPPMQPVPPRPVPQPTPPPAPLDSSGTLIVSLTHSKGLFPVVNARVCVTDTSGKDYGCKQTDSSGRTEEWVLPAPSRQNSMSPGTPNDVSAFYNIRIDAEGYVPVIIEGVPIFDGVRTLQPLDMFFIGAAPSSAPEVIRFSNSYTL